jgi:hypothetical protein
MRLRTRFIPAVAPLLWATASTGNPIAAAFSGVESCGMASSRSRQHAQRRSVAVCIRITELASSIRTT